MQLFLLVFGLIFLVVGLILTVGFLFAEMPIYIILFPLIFVAIGGVTLYKVIRGKLLAKKLRENGRRIWATVASVEPNYRVSYNGRHPYTVLCSAEGREFKTDTMKSSVLDLVGKTVPVLVSIENDKDYLIDLDEF